MMWEVTPYGAERDEQRTGTFKTTGYSATVSITNGKPHEKTGGRSERVFFPISTIGEFLPFRSDRRRLRRSNLGLGPTRKESRGKSRSVEVASLHSCVRRRGKDAVFFALLLRGNFSRRRRPRSLGN